MVNRTWEQIKTDVGHQYVANKIQWTKGYIVALEDLLRETSVLRQDPDKGTNYTKGQRNRWHGEVSMYKQIRRIAGHRLHLARQTLAALNRIGNDEV